MGFYEAAKDAFKLAQQSDNIELQKKILDLQNQAFQMVEDKQKLVKRVHELEKKLSDQDNYVLENNVYWKGPDKGGPFCPHCGPKGNWVHLSTNDGLWFCAVCKNGVPKPGSGLR